MLPAAELRQDRKRAPLVDECGDRMDLNILDLMTLRRGHFRYEFSYHGEIWLELDQLFFDPRRLAPFVRELAAKLKGDEVEVVVGLARRRVSGEHGRSRAWIGFRLC